MAEPKTKNLQQMNNSITMTAIFITEYGNFTTQDISILCEDFFEVENHKTIINILEDDTFSSSIYMVGQSEDNEIYISLTNKEEWQHITKI